MLPSARGSWRWAWRTWSGRVEIGLPQGVARYEAHHPDVRLVGLAALGPPYVMAGGRIEAVSERGVVWTGPRGGGRDDGRSGRGRDDDRRGGRCAGYDRGGADRGAHGQLV